MNKNRLFLFQRVVNLIEMESVFKKNVLIIGATGGIGRETAKLLKGSNANLFLTSTREEALRSLGTELGISPDQQFIMDITNPDEVRQVAASIPSVDVIVNLAGIGIIKPIEKLEYEEFSRTIDINLKGTFNVLKSFLPQMKEEKKGLIINLPGVLGKTPMAGASAYAASKYGLNGMLKSVREELKRTQIRITNLYLGGTDTPFWDEIDLRVQRDKFVTAKEAAKSIWFLCQQPSSGVVSEMVLQPFNHQAI